MQCQFPASRLVQMLSFRHLVSESIYILFSFLSQSEQVLSDYVLLIYTEKY